MQVHKMIENLRVRPEGGGVGWERSLRNSAVIGI
jgi:hypothetical protein